MDPPESPTGPGFQPFVDVSHDPLSTFAADVDTASYDLFRQSMVYQGLPAPDTVRVEEYVNYFGYEYAAPAHDADVPFSVQLAAAPHILGRDTTVLRIGVQGKDAPPASVDGSSANLVFLIDVSGSMASTDKLPLVQQMLTESLDVLKPDDTIGIVTYASGTQVRLAPTRVSDRATIEGVIQSLAAGGSTAGAAGLELAYQLAELGFMKNGINHVLLCTDGDFNVGPASTTELVQFIEEKRATGITLTVLGFGSDNLNDPMMEAVSNAGNGIYGVITDADQATRYVHERLLSTIVHIAKDVKIQVEFNPKFVEAYRLIGYDNRILQDGEFRDDAVDAGEVGAGHRVTALYELVLAGKSIPTLSGAPSLVVGSDYDGQVEVPTDDLVLVKIRYKWPGATETDPAEELTASLAPNRLGGSVSEMDQDFQWAVAVGTFAEILRGSPFVDPAALEGIGPLVATQEQSADPDRVEFISLFETAASLISGSLP